MSDQQHPERRRDDPLVQLMVSMTGASAPEHETEPPGASADAVRAGHEPDRFSIRGILYVPGFVVLTLIVAYILVSGVFFNIKDPAPSPSANPLAMERNHGPINERFARISSSDPAATVKQPRLEYLKQTGEPEHPAYERSKLPLATGNSPELTPQDLLPENYADPATGRKVLAEYGWVDQAKGIASMPIDVAIQQLVDGKKLPVRKNPVKLSTATGNRANLSNSGRGGPSATATPPAAKH